MATMTSSRCRRAAAVVLLLAVAVVNCRRRDAEDDVHSVTLDRLLEPSNAALAAAARRHRDGHLPAGDKRGWRDNRVRVWGKRTALRHADDADDDGDKRSWHQNTVRVWGKRRGAATADRRSWAGNTIRVWGKRLDFGLTPEQVLDRYGAAPKRSTGAGGAPTLNGAVRGLSRGADVDGGTLGGDELITTRSKRSSGYRHHAGRWVVRRSVGHGPRWVAFRGPKRSWRTNVIRVWGKRAA